MTQELMSHNVDNVELLKAFFAQTNFHLLLDPREDIEVGHVYEQANNSLDIYRTHTLKDILKTLGAVRKEFKMPEPNRNIKGGDIEGKFSDLRDRGLLVGFFTGFFDKIKSGLGTNLFAKFQQRKVQDVIFSFTDHTRDSLLIGTINSSLKDFTIDYDIADSRKRYYVVIEAHRCRGLSIGIAGGTEKDSQFIFDAANMVKLDARSSSSSGGHYLVNIPLGNTKFAFGVVLGELIENRVMTPNREIVRPQLPGERGIASDDEPAEAIIKDTKITDNEFLNLIDRSSR